MTIIKGRLRPEGTNNYADVVHLETSADQIVETTDKKVMTAAERTKLNGIEAGATKDMTAAEILALLKTVDGSGSGLDADLLDGKQASAFFQSTSSVFVTGIYTGNDQVSRFINLGFTPKAILLFASTYGITVNSLYFGGLALDNSPVQYGTRKVLEIVANGFNVFLDTSFAGYKVFSNSSDTVYNYIAFK